MPIRTFGIECDPWKLPEPPSLCMATGTFAPAMASHSSGCMRKLNSRESKKRSSANGSAAGLEILRGNGLNPRLFVAPRHGFDYHTLRALASEGLGILSDGFARRPFMRHDILWIPQQLWEPVRKKSGLWTICIHTNTAPSALEYKLEKFLEEHAHRFTNFDRVISRNQRSPLRWSERVEESLARLRARVSARKSHQLSPA